VGSVRNLVAGLILVALGGIAALQASSLTLGTPRHIGPGMVPLMLSGMIALIGVILVALGIRERQGAPQRWPLRAPIFLLGAAAVFGLVIRPLGLVAAGPLLVIVAALASDETRWIECLWFALGMTLFCVILFKYLLGLPIPLAPWLVGY
jgi:putative tricarboxylic transport membrane protein